MEKVAEVLAAATVTEAGTVRAEFVLDSVTLAPPAGAGWVKATVQLLEELGPRLAGLHASDETDTGGAKLTVVLAELPLYVAVIVALCELVMAIVVTENCADVLPAVTVTDPGTVSVELVLDKVTPAPPVGATPLSVTVHVEVPELVKLVGVQERDPTPGEAPPVTIPPVAERGRLVPAAEAAKPLVIGIDVEVALVVMTRFSTATLPFEMMPAFMPETKHVYVPVPTRQLSVLPAADDAAPAVAEIEATLAGG
jgi:hypothetical protein